MKSLWLIVIPILLGGCESWQSKPPSMSAATLPSKYQFDYKIANGEPISLIRVFDDGGSTYFQFRANPLDALVISARTTNGEAIIPHEVMGNYAVIRGVYRSSSIPAAAQAVIIHKLGEIALMANIGPVILPKIARESRQPVAAEPVPVVADKLTHDSGDFRPIRFRRNSAVLSTLGQKTIASLIATSGKSGDVEIRVRPFYPNRRASVRLAEMRAKVIRQAFIEAGYAESRLRISADSSVMALVAEVRFLPIENQATNGATEILTSMGIESVSERDAKPGLFSTLKLLTRV